MKKIKLFIVANGSIVAEAIVLNMPTYLPILLDYIGTLYTFIPMYNVYNILLYYYTLQTHTHTHTHTTHMTYIY